MSTQPGTDLNFEQLLRSATAAARDGRRGAAHALFLALSREHADEPRAWLGVAATTGDPAEQRAALERAVALDPANERARRALERLGQPAPGTTTVLPETLTSATTGAAASTPTATYPAELPPAPAAPLPPEADRSTLPASGAADHDEHERTPFPLLNLIAVLVILLLLLAVGVVVGRNLLGAAQTGAAPTATLVLVTIPGAGGAPTPPLGESLPTAAPTAPAAPATAVPPVATAPATPPGDTPGAATASPAVPEATPPDGQATAPPAAGTPAPTAPASPDLPLGQIIDYDGWSATLLRPDYAVSLDGAIGDLQPAGRFVLAVVAISNNSPAPRLIPPDLFTLTDSAGQRYLPVPGASSAYLALYGRGERGDLALEDVIDPGSGMRSVPLIFDVPTSATGLHLMMAGAASAGWPIGGPAPAPVGP